MKIGLIGNPNVGKSSIFNQLTGLGVAVSNYPGTTVDLERGNVCFKSEKFEICDLPGIYSLDGTSIEEALVRGVLERKEVDAVIEVIDAVHLERNLYLLFQVAEYGLPMLVVLNMADEAEKQGIIIDFALLSELLGSEVLVTAAIQGRGIEQIIPLVLNKARPPVITVGYDSHIEAAERSLRDNFPISRPTALLALEGIGDDQDLLDSGGAVAREIEHHHHMSPVQIISANRHHLAREIADKVTTVHRGIVRFDPDRLLTKTIPGVPILIAILLGILLVVFAIGSWMEGIIVSLFETFIVVPVLSLGFPPLIQQVLTSVLLAVQAGLGIALPFVFTFYIFIAILEDSGYLTRAAFLADRSMHRLGMHGQGIIPMILGFGCTVPAIMSIRLLATRRERFIASFLVTMIPCSARTVVIAGVVATFVGLPEAFSIYFIVLGLVFVTGMFLSRITPGERYGMIMEMAPLRSPVASNVVKKSWRKIREFLIIAMPLLVVSSVILGVLQYTGVIAEIQNAIAPFSTNVLGLPAYATTALIFGILRKETALGTLVVLAGTPALNTVMTSVQLYIFAIVNTLFIPCISTIAVLYKQTGLKTVVLVSLFTVLLGISIGALIHLTFP
ncbi:MAG TPA: ferrous iron transport protein B [Methanoregulaceae archaeon]|nr:ferrous iron transport protein B [Methanoregulaceae archaeon]